MVFTYSEVKMLKVKCFFLFWIPWGKAKKTICGSYTSVNLIKVKTRFLLTVATCSPHNLHCGITCKTFHCGFLTYLVCDCNRHGCLDVHNVSQFCCRLRRIPREVRRTVKLKQFLPDTLIKTVKVGQIRMELTIGVVLFWLCTYVFHHSLVSPLAVLSHRFFSLSERVNPLFHIYCVIDWKCVITEVISIYFFFFVISWLLSL